MIKLENEKWLRTRTFLIQHMCCIVCRYSVFVAFIQSWSLVWFLSSKLCVCVWARACVLRIFFSFSSSISRLSVDLAVILCHILLCIWIAARCIHTHTYNGTMSKLDARWYFAIITPQTIYSWTYWPLYVVYVLIHIKLHIYSWCAVGMSTTSTQRAQELEKKKHLNK